MFSNLLNCCRRAIILALGLACAPARLAAQVADPAQRAPATTAIQGPRSPEPPDVVARDEAGGTTVRATHVTEPITVDGRLDESVYQAVRSIGDFIQQVPAEGKPATEKTEVWVMFDADHVYVAARCWDSAPPDQWVANDFGHDTSQLRQNDTFGVSLDTFHDRRNGFVLYTNPLGARADYAVSDETANFDWNPVWEVRTGRFEGGWTVEMQVPFKSLRYRSGSGQLWGIQLRRVIRRKNEWTYLSRVPASAAGPYGLTRVSFGATLVGLDLPGANKNFELKPYSIARLTTDRTKTPPISNDTDGDLGIDVKYGVTANLTADVTYNTDFAQVEVDEQQVNLTRFSLLFPEKREFFLEGRGLFEFGRGPGGAGATQDPIVPMLFFSRRIGLEKDGVVPILIGGRLSGKAGRFGIGALNIQTKDGPAHTPATNFTVLRVKRDVLRRSSIGAMLTNRSNAVAAPGSNQAFGVDTLLSFYEDVNLSGYFARTRTPDLEGGDTSYQARFVYNPDRYGVQLDHLFVGEHFNPEVGYLRRDDSFRRTFALLRFSPRPRSIESVRKFTWEGSLEYILNGARDLDTRQQQVRFNTEFENSDQLTFEATSRYELLVEPFEVTHRVVIPGGGYQFSDVLMSYQRGAQHRAYGTFTVQRGNFYAGTITALGFGPGRIEVTKHFSLEPSVSINRIDLPQGKFTTNLLRNRTVYAFTPRMFASGLLQYNSDDQSFSSNLRLRWEYSPGSELFVVYTDERDTARPGFPTLQNRAFVVKINRLFRF